jgi:O-methyltransferase domain/Dimerisation domain
MSASALFVNLSFEVLSGFMTARYVGVGANVGVFRCLAAGPATLAELARDLGMPKRTTRILADALVASGMLRRHGERYHNGQAAMFLSGEGPFDLSGLVRLGAGLRLPWPRVPGEAGWTLRLWREVIEPQWAGLEIALREDSATFKMDQLSPEQQRLWSEGIALLTAPAADTLARIYPFGRHHRALDLGGGTGSFVLAALRRHSNLTGTLFEVPRVADLARARLAGDPVAARLAVVAGDLFAGPILPDHDAIILANVAHLFAPARNLALLHQVRAAAPPGARLLLVDFWTNAARTDPPLAALMAGSFQTITGEGDVYSASEAGRWLAASGWRVIARHTLGGALSAIVAEAEA